MMSSDQFQVMERYYNIDMCVPRVCVCVDVLKLPNKKEILFKRVFFCFVFANGTERRDENTKKWYE